LGWHLCLFRVSLHTAPLAVRPRASSHLLQTRISGGCPYIYLHLHNTIQSFNFGGIYFPIATLAKVELNGISDHFYYIGLGHNGRAKFSSALIDKDLHHHVPVFEVNHADLCGDHPMLPLLKSTYMEIG
jgi:hypothetical protein